MASREALSCLVDSDIVIDVLRRRHYTRPLLERWAARGPLAVSVVTHLEVYQGMRPGEEEATGILLDGLVSIPVDAHLARQAGLLLREVRTRGFTLGIADALVAATALSLGVPLLTNNVEHYPFPGLNVVRGAVG